MIRQIFIITILLLFFSCKSKKTPEANTTVSEKPKQEEMAEVEGAKSDGCIDPSKIQDRACPRNYDPVCGCNGRSYSNACEAETAGVLKYYKGKCEDCVDASKAKPDQACPENWAPVCGCNGKTYGNICEARKNGVKKWTEGECNK